MNTCVARVQVLSEASCEGWNEALTRSVYTPKTLVASSARGSYFSLSCGTAERNVSQNNTCTAERNVSQNSTVKLLVDENSAVKVLVQLRQRFHQSH